MKRFLTDFQRDALAVFGAAMVILPAIVSIARRLGIGIAVVAAFGGLVVLGPITIAVARSLRRRKQAVEAQIHPLWRDPPPSRERLEEADRRTHWVNVLLLSAPISFLSLLLPHFDAHLDDPNASDVAFELLHFFSGIASLSTTIALVVLLFLTVPSLTKSKEGGMKSDLWMLPVNLVVVCVLFYIFVLVADKRSAAVYLLRPYLGSLIALSAFGLLAWAGALYEAIQERMERRRRARATRV